MMILYGISLIPLIAFNTYLIRRILQSSEIFMRPTEQELNTRKESALS